MRTKYVVVSLQHISAIETKEQVMPRLLDENVAYGYAEYLLSDNPDDIVMVVPVYTSRCKHCFDQIHEKPGYLVHRWVHYMSGAYTCFRSDLTQAVPDEEVPCESAGMSSTSFPTMQ